MVNVTCKMTSALVSVICYSDVSTFSDALEGGVCVCVWVGHLEHFY